MEPRKLSDPESVARHVAERLRARRREMGLSRLALARRSGVPSWRLGGYERGELPVGAGCLWRLSRALDRPVDFFFPS